MNDDIDDIENWLPEIQAEKAATKHTPPPNPGKIDSVLIWLDEGETDSVLSADDSEQSSVIRKILRSNSNEIERLCHHFIDPATRYTLDEQSLDIENCEFAKDDTGHAYCVFTASVYWGCRDMDDVADERDCTLDFSLDRQNWTITISTTVPDYEPESYEEF